MLRLLKTCEKTISAWLFHASQASFAEMPTSSYKSYNGFEIKIYSSCLLHQNPAASWLCDGIVSIYLMSSETRVARFIPGYHGLPHLYA